MKRTKRLISLILIFALLFSTLEMVRFSASTTDTRYSVKHLQNGNFEENVGNYKFSSNYAQPNKTSVPYWDTTAYGSNGNNGMFEFFKSGSSHFDVTKKKYPNNPEYLNVADSNVAAELNADEESTIYQRIITVPGSTYTWGLYHRGRDITDSMVLIIGPEQYDNSGKAVDPSKPSKTDEDQFVRITKWLSKQYGVVYPKTGCSQKYTVYTKPFAEKGKFVNEDSENEYNNISLNETGEINQEWSVWVISSPYCNTSEKNTKNGWSAYGTRTYEEGKEDFKDILKGASSSLGYDCTYTVPKNQKNTIFAFCSYSSGRLSGSTEIAAPTFGNLLDGINFDLYQPISTSITEGGIGSAGTKNPDESYVTIKSDIISGNALNSMILDGQECTIYTKQYNDGNIRDYKFQGAYITVNNDDGTPVTKFLNVYQGDDINSLTDEKLKNLSKTHFIPKKVEVDNKEWDYYCTITVSTPVTVHLIYTKAPYVLYDSNGGKTYKFSPDNSVGGNLIGFADSYQEVYDDDNNKINTTGYYSNCVFNGGTSEGEQITVSQEGKYISHSALPNDKWDKNSSKFCGWSVKDSEGNQIILNGVHTITYNPTTGTGGDVVFKDTDNTVNGLTLDASHGVTLTAVWKFIHRAQAQTYDENTNSFKDSAVGGTVEETLIPDDLRESDVSVHTDSNGKVDRIDAAAKAGDIIMFKATSDYKNDYVFKGWYCKNSKTDEYELRSVSSSIAVTVEEGKLNTYYARFQKKSNPVIFKYTKTGSFDGYDYYDKTVDLRFGKYYQEVPLGATATQPTGDTKNVKIWFTSPTERGTEYVFDFSTPINKETILYAGPTFAYNYFNFFKLKEPWYINTYGTVKVDGKYIDLKKDPDVSDYNVYMLKGTLDESAPKPSEIKNNSKTIKVGKSVNSKNLIYNNVTKNTNYSFNRAGTTFSDFYLFNMKTPVWVVFDFTYKGVKYTSTVKDRCLYNNITTYMKEASNGLYTDYPPATQAELQAAQKTLLDSIQAMYNAVEPLGITEPTAYADAAEFDKNDFTQATDKQYTFRSTTAIRNIEPWGLKYTFKVDNQTVTDFADYGAIIMTDTAEAFNDKPVTVDVLLNNENSVMYSKSNNNIYDGGNGVTEVYYVNNMLALDFDKNTYAVFFVKDREGKTYYSDPVKNSYNSIASKDTSEYADVSKSIMNYSNALINYTNLVKKAESEKG